MPLPGAEFVVTTLSGVASPAVPQSADLYIAGFAERGSTVVPAEVRSVVEYDSKFGADVAYSVMRPTLRTFFERGGGRAFVLRLVGPAATTASVTLQDAVPAPALTVSFASAGPASLNWQVVVAAGLFPSTVRIAIKNPAGVEVEVADGLATQAEILAYPWTNVRMVSAGTGMPAVATSTFAAGTDDRAAVTPAIAAGALTKFAVGELADSLVNFGRGGKITVVDVSHSASTNTLALALKSHANTHGRLAMLVPDKGTSEAATRAWAIALRGTDGNNSAVFGPHIEVVDGAVRKFVPPSGYVAALSAQTHASFGPTRAPVGQDAGRIDGAIGPEYYLGVGATEVAVRSLFNPIVRVNGRLQLRSFRSLSSDPSNWGSASVADTINTITDELNKLAEKYIGLALTPRTIRIFKQDQETLLSRYDLVPLTGTLPEGLEVQLDPGFAVNVGPSVNTPALNSAGIMASLVGVRPPGAIELVRFTITRAGLAVPLAA